MRDSLTGSLDYDRLLSLSSDAQSDFIDNCLELLASFHALQFNVLFRRLAMDNTTAVSFVNYMGSVRSPLLDSLSKTTWAWCRSKEFLSLLNTSLVDLIT